MKTTKAKNFVQILALIMIAMLSACSRSSNISNGNANADRMLQTIEHITKTPRQYGEKELEPARQYLIDTFVEYGYEVSLQEFNHEQEEVVFLDGYAEADPDELVEGKHYQFADITRTGSNIVAVKHPISINHPKDILIVCAHYDSVMDSPGANDNGSGIAALLEIARLIKDTPSNVELRLIAFDGEESLLLGSYFYVSALSDEELSRIIGVINFDMFASINADGLQMSTIDGRHNFLSEMFDGFKLRDEKSSSDHINFVSAAIPVVSISHEPDSLMHTPEDTLEFIDQDKLVTAVDKGVEVIKTIISTEPPPYSENSQILSDIVFDLELDMDFPFWQNIQTVETELGIETDQIPMRSPEPSQVIMDFTATIDWWGEPLETHFIYDFYAISDSMLSHISIKLNDVQSTKAILGGSFEYIEDVENYTFYYMENENITEAWLNGENAFIISSSNDIAELVIVSWEIN